MTDMIERVARAIMEAREGSGKGTCRVKDWQSEYRENPHVKQVVDQAIAAIKAMREPSKDMVSAVREIGGTQAAAYAIAAWPTMVDAALKGTEQ